MNTTPGPRLIEPGDRLPLAPCRLQGRLRRGRQMRRLTVGQRALAFGRLRGRSGMFRKAGASETNRRKGRTSPARSGADKWTREKSKSCAKRSAARPCWRQTAGRSTSRKAPARAIKYRRDSNIVIVIHEGRGWFDPLSPAKGDVFSLAEHLGADGFVEACDHVADVVGFVPSAPAWQRPARPKAALASIAERWGHRFKPSPGSPAWRYLTRERGLPADIVKQAVALRSAARRPARQHVGGA